MAVDLPVEVVRGHGGERGRPFSLALAPLLLDLDGGIDAACDELKPVAGLVSRPLQRGHPLGGARPGGGGACGAGGGGGGERGWAAPGGPQRGSGGEEAA